MSYLEALEDEYDDANREALAESDEHRHDRQEPEAAAQRMVRAVERDVSNLFAVAMIMAGIPEEQAHAITASVQDQLIARLEIDYDCEPPTPR